MPALRIVADAVRHVGHHEVAAARLLQRASGRRAPRRRRAAPRRATRWRRRAGARDRPARGARGRGRRAARSSTSGSSSSRPTRQVLDRRQRRRAVQRAHLRLHDDRAVLDREPALGRQPVARPAQARLAGVAATTVHGSCDAAPWIAVPHAVDLAHVAGVRQQHLPAAAVAGRSTSARRAAPTHGSCDANGGRPSSWRPVRRSTRSSSSPPCRGSRRTSTRSSRRTITWPSPRTIVGNRLQPVNRACDAPRMPRVRLEDVARAAGVSKSTASRALNDPLAPLREETRARVRKAVEELAYRPHAGARALKRADTGALGLVVPDLTNPVWARIVRGAVNRARERDFSVLLIEDVEPAATQAMVVDLVRRRPHRRARDGVRDPRPPARRARCPTCSCRTSSSTAPSPAAAATSSRATPPRASSPSTTCTPSGHRAVGLVSGPPGLSTIETRAGLVRRARRAARPGRRADRARRAVRAGRRGGDARAARRRAAGDRGRRQPAQPGHRRPVATLWEAGLEVPGDVSIVCYDDLPLADYLRPALTRVRVPLAELGAAGRRRGDRPGAGRARARRAARRRAAAHRRRQHRTAAAGAVTP